MKPLLAGIDGLVGLLIFAAISIIGSWLQKRQQGGETGGTPAPPPGRPRPAGAPAPRSHPQPAPEPGGWEEELKRLLGGDLAGTKPSPAPPPPIVVQAPRRMPYIPPPVSESSPAEPEPAHRSVFDIVEEANPTDVRMEPNFQPLAELSESLQTHQQASELDHTVVAHLRKVTQHPIGLTSVQHKAATPEASVALALLRNPKSARSAILVSLILGPPRALAE